MPRDSVVVLHRHNELLTFRDDVIRIARTARRVSLIVNDTDLPNRALKCANADSPGRTKALFLANYRLADLENLKLSFYSDLLPGAERIIRDWERRYRKRVRPLMNFPPQRDYILEYDLFHALAAARGDAEIYVGDSFVGTFKFFQLLNAARGEPLRLSPLNKYRSLPDTRVEPARPKRRVVFFAYGYMTDIRYFEPIMAELSAAHGIEALYVCQRYCYARHFGHPFVPYEVYRPRAARKCARQARPDLLDSSYSSILRDTYAFQRLVFRSFLERETPDVVVTRDDTLPFVSWLDEYRRQMGFRVIHVPHGADQISRTYQVAPWFADRCALGARIHKHRPASARSTVARKLVFTGDLLREDVGLPRPARALVQRSAGRKVLFLPSQGGQETRKIIELLTPVLRRRPDYLLVVKTNPFENFIDYERETRRIDKAQVWVTSHRDLNSLIVMSHALITANSASFLNAIQLGVPVLAFTPLMSRTVLRQVPGVLHCFETSGELAAILRRVDTLPRSEIARRADRCLREHFPTTAARATRNITELIVDQAS